MPALSALSTNPETADIILDRMANGEILTAICREIGITPGAVSHFAERNQAFGQRYARARLMQAAAVAEDVVRIVDEEDDPERAQLARNRADARKWLASKLDPAKFADKHRHEVTGEDGGPIQVETKTQVVALLAGAFDALEPPTIDHEEDGK